ncbi:tetratricopeptide repeat protein [Thalassobellus suaedae]|uniref:Sel1 repeat family protein n=1 Tax=Thalassobellus suaedae TaxID=3074124 RepID=A0ABY9Y7C6_9FLAO|nr:hypothetical protein RHP49_07945 [Flavobacteriaceae bacterium HL-DH10]
MKIKNFKLLFLSFTLTIFISLKTNAQQVSSELKAQAENGDAEAQFEMGKAYFGYGSSKKRTQAEKWLLMATEQGHDKATYLLSQLRFSKYECPIEVLKKLALEGYSEAQFSLGARHQNYLNDSLNDLSIAYKWMLLSSKDPYERYHRTWSLINHFKISHLEISRGQKMAKEHAEKYGPSKSIYSEN